MESLAERVRAIVGESKEPVDTDEIRVLLKQKFESTVTKKDINQILYAKGSSYEVCGKTRGGAPKWKLCEWKPLLAATDDAKTARITLTIIVGREKESTDELIAQFMSAAAQSNLLNVEAFDDWEFWPTIQRHTEENSLRLQEPPVSKKEKLPEHASDKTTVITPPPVKGAGAGPAPKAASAPRKNEEKKKRVV